MAPFKRKKSKKDVATSKGTAIVQAAKRQPVKRWLPIAGAAIVALVATKIVRGRHGDPAAA